MKKNYRRGLLISIMVIAISVLNFMNLDNSECIRPIHIVTLLVCGMGVGVLLVNLFGLITNRDQQT